MKYVDIEPLTKEIDSLYDEWCGSSTGLEVGEEGASIGAAESIFEEVRKIIDSLQQEQPQVADASKMEPGVDLKKELKNFIKNNDNGCFSLDIARHFYELGLNARKEDK